MKMKENYRAGGAPRSFVSWGKVNMEGKDEGVLSGELPGSRADSLASISILGLMHALFERSFLCLLSITREAGPPCSH